MGKVASFQNPCPIHRYPSLVASKETFEGRIIVDKRTAKEEGKKSRLASSMLMESFKLASFMASS